MKKYLAVLAIAVLGFTISCTKASPEAEAKAMMSAMTKLTESSAEKLENAASAQDAASALIAYAEGMKAFAEKGKELEKKYPSFDPDNDEKFKAESEEFEKAMKKFIDASTKASMKYVSSREFMDAVSKMQEIMK
ncbi:MAG: hypothetical protein GXY14_06430 [Spirochaetes bacterium]|nr:hypothetical protein [Spirochaetota bacterium]